MATEPLYPQSGLHTPGGRRLTSVAVPPAAVGSFVVAGAGSLAVASLALAHVVAPWGVLFLFVLPAMAFLAWTVAELAPSRRPQPPAASPPQAPTRSTRARRVVNLLLGLTSAGILVLVARELGSTAWPFRHTDVNLTAAAGALILTGAAPRALGWQRLFRPLERPRSLALAAGGAAASVTGLALPSRLSDAVRVAIVHRLEGRRLSMTTLVLSLLLLGMVEAGALAPFAAVAAITAPVGATTRVGFAIVAAAGIGAALVVAGLPRIRRHERLGRLAVTRRLDRHVPESPRDAAWAWGLVTVGWACRSAGIILLLKAVGIGASMPLALGYVTASAAVAALPIGPAGAATSTGVGAAMLANAGIGAQEAIAVALAAQALSALASTAVLVFAGALRTTASLRLRRA